MSKWKVLPQLKEGARISGEGRQIVDEHGSVIALVYAAGRNDKEGERIAYEMAHARTNLEVLEETHKALTSFATNVNRYGTVDQIAAFNNVLTRARVAVLESKGDHATTHVALPHRGGVKTSDVYTSPESKGKPQFERLYQNEPVKTHTCNSSRACPVPDPYACTETRSRAMGKTARCTCGCHTPPQKRY